MIYYLPRIDFLTPKRYLYEIVNQEDEEMVDESSRKFIDEMFQGLYREEKYQRCCFYLNILHKMKANREAKKEQSKYNS